MVHSSRTDLNAKPPQVTNIDFVVLLLGKRGPTPVKDIYVELSKFRGKPINKWGKVGTRGTEFHSLLGE